MADNQEADNIDRAKEQQQTEQEPMQKGGDAPKTRTRTDRFISQPGDMTITYPKPEELAEKKAEK